jgi:predicted aconitase with swiveling domain
MTTFNAHVLVPGDGQGHALVLPEPLSLWGGLDPESGEIIYRRHPRSGETVTGRVLVLPAGPGSSSASSILLEAVRLDTAPAAIITAEADPILALGAAVAREMYDAAPPVVVLADEDYARLKEGLFVRVEASGVVEIGKREVSEGQ